MKVVAFNGSARKDGNTAILVRQVFAELGKEGIETELVQLSGEIIRGCTACYQCFAKKDGQCAVKGDLINECIEKMKQADGIVLASPARAEELHHAIEEGVDFQWLTNPLEFIDDGNGWLGGLRCQKMELGEPDASGRRKPVPIPGAEFELPVDMIIPAIGQEANLSPIQDSGIKLSRWGTIEVDEASYQTSREGVFAAGDVHTGPWIAIEAVGGGIEAAIAGGWRARAG